VEKTVILPEWRSIACDELDEPTSADDTVTEHEGYRSVVFSGATWPEGGLAE